MNSPHIGIFGSAGSGKSTQIESTILSWPYSLIIFDPTYEHLCMSSAWRSKVGACYKWAPLREFERQSRLAKHVRLNPMGPHHLDKKRPDFDTRAEGLAAGIVSKIEGSNRFFYDSPRGILAGMIMAQILHGKSWEQNLPYIAREIVSRNPYHYCRSVLSITKNPAVRARLERLTNGDEKFLKSIPEFMETLRTEMTPLLNDAVGQSLSAADITFKQFTQSVQTLYINAPLEQIGTFGPVNKLILGSILGELFQGSGGKVPCLIVMDELFQYGKDLEALPAAFAAGRKYNCVLMACMTTWSELKSMWPRDFEIVANNMGMLQFLDVGDVAGSEHVSKLLGEITVASANKTINQPTAWNIPPFYDGGAEHSLKDVLTDVPSDGQIAKELKVSFSYSQVKRPLMAPFQVRQELGPDEQLVFIRKLGRPLRLLKTPYHNSPWKRRAQPNPFYRK